jgi:hypothetical protein
VNAGGQQIRQCFVDEPVASDTAQTCKAPAHDGDLEVSLAFGAGPSMICMHVRNVTHDQAHRLEGILQALLDQVTNRHE